MIKQRLALIVLVLFFTPAVSQAIMIQDDTSGIYQDKNNFFTFVPPAGWIKEESWEDTESQVKYTSADGKAGLAIIASLNEGELNALFFDKKSYIKDYQSRFPKGKFNLDWVSLGERQVVKIDFQIPGVIKQEQYFFFDQGVRFDLVYGVADAANFKKYKQAALDAFVTVKRQGLVNNK